MHAEVHVPSLPEALIGHSGQILVVLATESKVGRTRWAERTVHICTFSQGGRWSQVATNSSNNSAHPEGDFGGGLVFSLCSAGCCKLPGGLQNVSHDAHVSYAK